MRYQRRSVGVAGVQLKAADDFDRAVNSKAPPSLFTVICLTVLSPRVWGPQPQRQVVVTEQENLGTCQHSHLINSGNIQAGQQYGCCGRSSGSGVSYSCTRMSTCCWFKHWEHIGNATGTQHQSRTFQLANQHSGRTTCLRGNHKKMMSRIHAIPGGQYTFFVREVERSLKA